MCKEVPDIATTEVSIEHRGNKLFVDPSQNDYADTLPARIRYGPISILLSLRRWNGKIKATPDPAQFTLDTLP